MRRFYVVYSKNIIGESVIIQFNQNIVFCLDNDPAGREALGIMEQKYADKGFSTRIELPNKKDFNEELLVFKDALCRVRTKDTFSI